MSWSVASRTTGAPGIAERALGRVDGLLADDGAHIVQRQAAGGDLVGIQPDADGGSLRPMEIDEADAVHLRDLLRDDVFGIVVELRHRHDVGGQGERQQGRVRRVDLVKGRRVGKVLRQSCPPRPQIAIWTSCDAALMSRARSNCIVIEVRPDELTEVICVTPETLVDSEFSSGVATEVAIVSALAPGRLAETWIVGKSTCGKRGDRQLEIRDACRAGRARLP